MSTKVDFINGAYSRLRISGLTVDPSVEDLELALNRLESMAQEFEGRNICTGYAFEDAPDPNTPHNVERKFWNGYESNLAARLLADFGKEVPVPLIAEQQTTFSFLSAQTAPIRRVQYPARQPRGSGESLRYNRWQRFYRPQAEAPLGCATNKMFIDDINDFVEHFDAYLNDAEEIASFTIEADTGLTVVSSEKAGDDNQDINYRISAVGNSGIRSDTFLQLKIVVTTDADPARVETRIINFELHDSDISP